jgi:hypothetical protein
MTLTEPIRYWTYIIPNLSDFKTIWLQSDFGSILFWTFLILNLSDSESIWFWTYLIVNQSDSELLLFPTFVILNQFDSEPMWFQTYLILTNLILTLSNSVILSGSSPIRSKPIWFLNLSNTKPEAYFLVGQPIVCLRSVPSSLNPKMTAAPLYMPSSKLLMNPCTLGCSDF